MKWNYSPKLSGWHRFSLQESGGKEISFLSKILNVNSCTAQNLTVTLQSPLYPSGLCLWLHEAASPYRAAVPRSFMSCPQWIEVLTCRLKCVLWSPINQLVWHTASWLKCFILYTLIETLSQSHLLYKWNYGNKMIWNTYGYWHFMGLKADRPHPCDYLHTPYWLQTNRQNPRTGNDHPLLQIWRFKQESSDRHTNGRTDATNYIISLALPSIIISSLLARPPKEWGYPKIKYVWSSFNELYRECVHGVWKI